MRAQLFALTLCGLGLIAAPAPAQTINFKPVTMKAKLQRAEITHNVVRNKEKGVLVKVHLEFEGQFFDKAEVLCLVLDKNKSPLTSLFAKKVMADDPEQFPNGSTADLFTVRKKTPAFKVVVPDLHREFGPKSVLDGPYSDEFGRFCDRVTVVATKEGKLTSNSEFFLPLSQFPLSGKGSYELSVRLEVVQHGCLLDTAEPFNFTFTIK